MRDIAVSALLAVAATDVLHEWSNPKWVGMTQKTICPDQIELDAHVLVMRPISVAASYMQNVGL